MIQDNLDVYLADHSVPCSAGSATFTGIFNTPGQNFGIGHLNAVTVDYELVIKASDALAAGLGNGSFVTIDGVAGYRVRERLPIDDGAFVSLTLSKP